MKPRAIFTRKLVTPLGKEPLRGKEMNSVEIMSDVYVVYDERIIEITKEPPGVNVQSNVDLLTPGFVDPHTHIPFYGYRSREFVMRSMGKSYVDILKEGGGIHFTVERVREASLEQLVEFNSVFLKKMISRGVTTVEGKSGYGLNVETELKQLRALKELKRLHPIDICATFLGAHAVPKDRDRWDYLRELVESLDEVSEYTDTVDIFVDEGAYTLEEARYFLEEAKSRGFRLRIHADEIVRTGASVLGVELGAVSVDHLIRIDDEDVEIIANSDTTAVLMPATSFFLKEPYAPARKLLDSGAIVALGTDFNPGSNTINDVSFVMHLAVSRLGMTPEEALTAFTLNSAHVLGLAEHVGTVEVGKYADMVAWNVPDLEAIPYLPGHDTVDFVVKRGEMVKI